MAFNDFLDKLKVSSADAVEKAKDTTKRLATINDLKSKIRGYNNDKNKLFNQMGMDLYIAKKQGENIDETLDDFVSQIDTINVRIKNLEEKLSLIETENKKDNKAENVDDNETENADDNKTENDDDNITENIDDNKTENADDNK